MAGEIYIKTGTEITFGSEAGDDYAWTTESISNGAGRQATLHDQGADGTARAYKWRYRFVTQAQATPVVGNQLQTYLKTSDGTHPDNSDGTTDAAVSSINKLLNLEPLNGPVVDQAAADIKFVRGGVVPIFPRYFGPVMWNAMGATTTADDTETKGIFTPIYEQIQ